MKQLYYFTSTTCTPCQMFGPVMDRVSKTHPVQKIVTDYALDVARANNVQSVPTVILRENGQELRRFTGVRSYEQVMQFING